jgi:hypothetical protein
MAEMASRETVGTLPLGESTPMKPHIRVVASAEPGSTLTHPSERGIAAALKLRILADQVVDN